MPGGLNITLSFEARLFVEFLTGVDLCSRVSLIRGYCRPRCHGQNCEATVGIEWLAATFPAQFAAMRLDGSNHLNVTPAEVDQLMGLIKQ